MEKPCRINWKRGLEITPEILIAADNYHITERNQLGTFLASSVFGILPDNHFIVEKRLENNLLMIKIRDCRAITKDGFIINIRKDNPFEKELSLTETMGEACYVVLTLNPNPFPNDNEDFIYTDYQVFIQPCTEPVWAGIPILKIYKNNENWDMDNHYIPPAIAFNAVDLLHQKYIEIKNLILTINTNNEFSVEVENFIALLILELNHYTAQKSPDDFVILMKKIGWLFQSFLMNSRNIKEIASVAQFLNEPYNPVEIEKILQLGLKSLKEMNEIFNIKPVEEEDIFEIKL